MSTVYGFIKVKETDEPIAGLVVLVAARGIQKTLTKTTSKSSDPFKIYTQRLGSTITDAGGKFQIDFDKDMEGKSKGQEQSERILAILAPATTTSIKQRISASSYNKLLYWVKLPHMSPNQTEACNIRLTEKQLKKFDIQIRSNWLTSDVEGQIAYLIETEKNSEKYHTAFQRDVAPLRKKRFERKKKIATEAKKFASCLSATPTTIQSHRYFKRSNEEVESKIKNAMEDGLVKIANAPAQNKGTMTVYLDDESLSSLGVNIIPAPLPDDTIFEIETDKLCQLMSERRGGTELNRVRGLLDAYKVEAEANARLEQDESESPNEDEVTGETQPVIEEIAPATAIAKRVLGQIKDMPLDTSASESTLPRAFTRDELNAMLPAVQLGAGPTDVPSFHDFFNLQIAFPHIWTEAFDEELRWMTEELYGETVVLHEDYGTEYQGVAELKEMADLRAFLRELQGQHYRGQPMPPKLREYIGIGQAQWDVLDEYSRQRIREICEEIALLQRYMGEHPLNPPHLKRIEQQIRDLKSQADSLLEANMDTRMMRLLTGISNRLSEPYAFHYFAPNTVNFGLLLTYRQYWQPGPYQVGDLVSTIPLAPGEKRRFETKHAIKRTRAETEMAKAMSSKSFDSTTTKRADAEITEKASLTSNFKMTAEGTFQFGIADIKSGTEFGSDQSQESTRIKKDFREAVLKAAQEYKQERTVEVRTTDDLSTEMTTSGELSNPNNELTVTYLLYELERQYTISERIHRVTPVILVAQDLPAPHEITESWLLTNEWILRRVILDDTLRPALDYISDAFAGEEVSISVHKANWENQVALVKELEATVKGLKSTRDVLRKGMIETQQEIDLMEGMEEADKVNRILRGIFTLGLSEVAPNPADANAKLTHEQKVALQKAYEERLKYTEEALAEKQENFISAQEALANATKEYTEAVKSQTNRRVAIDQLRIHIKENIFYYMQAIWDHEPPDQRFFRLYHINVNLPEAPNRTFWIRPATEDDLETGIPTVEHEGVKYIIQLDPPTLPDYPNNKPLVEIADLDHPLGYKGNYIIFPLKTCLYLTNFMMREFFDDYFGVRDPEVAANFSVEELLTYAEALIRDGKITDRQRAALQSIVMTKLRQPRRDSDLVVVPTGELFMEALLGEHVLLENFKLNHRFIDMAKARAEWRQTEIENLRRAARLLKEEPDLEDPDIDRHIVLEGPASDVHLDT